MARIRLQGSELDLDEPTLIEGFPGIGLVGKIATDHVIDQLDMRHYANVQCEGLPRVGIYRGGDPTIRPPVRVYASEEHDLLALRSDAPIAAAAVGEIADCVTNWIVDLNATPVYLSGMPAEKEGVPELFGVATGDGADLLDRHGIDSPGEDGVVSGPTGALINEAAQLGHDSVGLIVESSPQFPDPEAARVLIDRGIAPIAGIDVGVSDLVDRAEEIREQREKLAQRMREAGQEEATQAQPLRMYQ